jgi:hypothetical protein
MAAPSHYQLRGFGLTATVVLMIAAVVYFAVPAFLLPSGVWRRRVLREEPLKAPIGIRVVEGDTLVLLTGRYRLAGVTLPTDPAMANRAVDLLRVCTAQGVEVIRRVGPDNTFILRSEPRIWHGCGRDPVQAHYQRVNLNELLLLFGYATFDPNATGLTERQRQRFGAAEAFARALSRGMWTREPRYADRSFDDSGLSISAANILRLSLEPEDQLALQR